MPISLVRDAPQDMPESNVTRKVAVSNRQGIHARSAALMAETARRFDARVVVVKNQERAECTDVLHVMSLGLAMGEEFELEATGPQAAEATELVADLILVGLREIEDEGKPLEKKYRGR